MSTRSSAASSRDVRRVQRQFERWRSRRRSGSRIPDRLWQAAADLASELGVSKAAHALRLDYYALKQRVESAPGRGLDDGGGGGFVEIPVAAARGSGACVLEIEDTSGVRLRMEVQGMPAVELGSLVRSVLGAER